MELRTVKKDDYPMLYQIYDNCDYKLCSYSVGCKEMWMKNEFKFAISSNCLIGYNNFLGKKRFDFPIPINLDNNHEIVDFEIKPTTPLFMRYTHDQINDIRNALMDISRYCAEHSLPMEFWSCTRAMMSTILSVFPEVSTDGARNVAEYIYLAKDLAEFKGEKYQGRRNHVKKFLTTYPEAVFKEFTKEDIPRIKAFFDKFRKENTLSNEDEFNKAYLMLDDVGCSIYRCGGYTYKGEVISFCMAEKVYDTLIEHIEKASNQYIGVYPATVTKFAQVFGYDVKYINREDDNGRKGLRMSKLQYNPCEIIQQYHVKVKNHLFNIDKIPKIEGPDDICLTPIFESDIDDYNRLCLDDELNKYWGYDYRSDCEHPDYRYFYEDQLNLFREKVAVCFAIRYKGRFAGEAILYNFDNIGSAELGVRILPEYFGLHLGQKAYLMASNFGLYTLGLVKVVGKCMKPNEASKKMLSLSMKLVSSDDTFYYFEKLV